MQNRIVLVEDDDELRALISRYLGEQGFSVRQAANGAEGLALARDGDCDLVVLDIMLPDISGLDVLRKLRETTHLPVVLLTARGEETDRIVGFEVGADDYIPKPCNPRELVARLDALLRRVAWGRKSEPETDLIVGELRVLREQRRASYRNTPLDLTGTEFEILRVLATHAGAVVRKTDLMQWALGRRLATHDRTLDMHVSNLRRKLAEHSAGAIDTVRGLGYSFRSVA